MIRKILHTALILPADYTVKTRGSKPEDNIKSKRLLHIALILPADFTVKT